MIILGLTGSIGMGKSTTATMFRNAGIPVHDADATVHDLYKNELVQPIGEAFPGSIVDGMVDRAALGKLVVGNEKAMKTLEEIVHPAVRQRELDFLEVHRKQKVPFVVLDIPLLFETKGNQRVDKVLVVTAPFEIQRQRVLERDGMSEEKFNQILARQVPDAEKRAQADFLIDTSHGLESAQQHVHAIIDELSAG